MMLSLAAFSLATPALLWVLLLGVPVLLFHLYHRRRVVVPFLPLLVEAVGPRRPGGGWRRLRDRASLVLRLLALAALVLALAGLAPARAGPPPRALVLVIDADVTTGAREADGRTRYAHALELARRILRSEPWREVAVVEAREAPEVVAAPTDDVSAAEGRLSRLRDSVARGRRAPAAATTDLDAAVRAALDLAAAGPPASVEVLTARALPDREPREGEPEVAIRGVGRTREDQGFTAFDLATVADGARVLLRAAVRNDADAIRTRKLVIEVGAEVVLERTLDLAPGPDAESIEVELFPPREGGRLRVRLDGEDAYSPNDEVVAWLAPPLRPSVLVVHDGGVRPYTRAILEAMEDGLDVAASGTVRAADLSRAEPRDVTIVDGVDLPDGALRPGAWLFLAPLGGGLPFEVLPPVTEPLVWRSAPDHPLVADLDLGAAWIARGYPVTGDGLVSLAEADGATVLGEGEGDGIRYVFLGLDPEGSDLPLRAAFPLLVQAAIRRLAAVPVAPLEPYYRAGGRLRPRLPLPGGPAATVRWAGGEASARVDPADEAWRVPAGARGDVEVATASWSGRTAFVDVDPARTIVPVREAQPAPSRAAAPSDGPTRWRRALLALAVLLLLVDLLLLVLRDRAGRKLDPGFGRA